jgi:hypothetical protein
MVDAMGRGSKRIVRRTAAAFALLGVALYALLLPGHLTSQFVTHLFAAEYGFTAEAMCGSGTAGKTIPGAPDTGCPICKGLVAFHLAISPPQQPDVPAPAQASASFDALRDDLTGTIALAPRNRGPPSLLA